MRQQYELLRTQETMYLRMKNVVQGLEVQVDHLEQEKQASQKLIASLEARIKALEGGDEVFVTPAPSMPNLSEPIVGGDAEEDLLLSMELDADSSGDQEVTTEASA